MADCSQGKLIEQKVDMVEQNSKQWWSEMKKDIEKLTSTIESLPDMLGKRLDENIELKIENRITKTENKFLLSVIGLTTGLIIEGILLVASFLLSK